MASRDFVRRLNNVDFPTFGRPTRAITGFIECNPLIRTEAVYPAIAGYGHQGIRSDNRRGGDAGGIRGQAIQGTAVVARQQMHEPGIVPYNNRPPQERRSR